MRVSNALLLGIAGACGSFFTPGAASAALIFQAQAEDYNPATGTLTTDVGPDAGQADLTRRPTLVPGQTANGSAVLRFDGTDVLTFTALTSITGDYTVFAYVRAVDNSSADTIISGSAGSIQYRVGGDSIIDRQQLIRRSQQNLGSGTTEMSSTAFNNINVATGPTSTSFRLNGAADGNGTASTYTAGLEFIGAGNAAVAESYIGDIAEIRVYDTLMTASERAVVESQLVATYVPEPGTAGLLGLGGIGLLMKRRRIAAR